MYLIGLGTEVAALNSQVVPISQVALKTGLTVVECVLQYISLVTSCINPTIYLRSQKIKAEFIYNQNFEF